MEKRKIIESILAQLEVNLIAAKDSAKISREAATNEESKPENEYDTRALEASYLAGAQSRRVAEIEELISFFKFSPVKDFKATDKISATALVHVTLEGKKMFLFVMGKGGGLSFNCEGHNVQIVTPNSPLGEALLDLGAGDTAVVEIGDDDIEYDIISVQ